jgi:hypothetical protein
MGALDGGMARDQLPRAVPVADAAPAADDVTAAEQGGLEVERVEPAAALRTGAAVDELEDQATPSGGADEILDRALVDGDHITASRNGVCGRLRADRGVTTGTRPEPQRGRRSCHCQ